jgi:hypothetical protein
MHKLPIPELIETQRHDGTNCSAFPATPFTLDAFVDPFVDQRLTLFRTVDRLSFTQTQEQNR